MLSYMTMDERKAQQEINQWADGVLDVADALLQTRSFDSPRVMLNLSDEALLELTLHYGYDSVNWCLRAMTQLINLESLYQRKINPTKNLLTDSERNTFVRLQKIARLKRPD